MQIFASFIIAFGFSLLFLVGYRSKALSTSYVFLFFLILFMTGLAAQYWIIPFGPTIYGVSWMPLLGMMLIVSLLFAAPSPYQNTGYKRVRKDSDATIPIPAGIFTWVLLVILTIAVIVGIYNET